MRLYGIDFTSAPSPRKPIVVAEGRIDEGRLAVLGFEEFPCLEAWQRLFERPGPWVAALDAPLGLPRALVAELAWPGDWSSLVAWLAAREPDTFVEQVDALRRTRPAGARYLYRRCDRLAGAASPMNLVRPPVGRMFRAAVPTLWQARVSVLPQRPLAPEDSNGRVLVEGYPGYLVRRLGIGSYKRGTTAREDSALERERGRVIAALSGWVEVQLGLRWHLPPALAHRCRADSRGDRLDAVILVAQAAWVAGHLACGNPYGGLPEAADPLEGWIATVPWDEAASAASAAKRVSGGPNGPRRSGAGCHR
ncbi:MAG: DUF429 domain-containing protein [Casimicrobiaceae bacterium]|nr:DUF429 domain-containing protein [Casimicrobiaceae bacterium]MCX8097995.1 DUF429 domain-containing protein [Casimicrobiaceae bacterium]MDW8311710.1 DUF429 domain-containing protein [Burkholderiales bacterium]